MKELELLFPKGFTKDDLKELLLDFNDREINAAYKILKEKINE